MRVAMSDLDDLLRLVQQRRVLDPGIARLIRLRAGLSQAEVAGAVGVSRGALARYEAGERTPRGEQAARYAETLHRLMAALESTPPKVLDRDGRPGRAVAAGGAGGDGQG